MCLFMCFWRGEGRGQSITITSHLLEPSKPCSIHHILWQWDLQLKTESISENYFLVFILHLSHDHFIWDTCKSLDLPPKSSVQQTSIGRALPMRSHQADCCWGVVRSLWNITRSCSKTHHCANNTAQKLCAIKLFGTFWRQRLNKYNK